MKVKKYELDEEEQEILDAYEKGKLKSVPNFTQVKKEAMEAASNTRSITFQVSAETFQKLKAKAAHEGIPYQTLASSILHKYANK